MRRTLISAFALAIACSEPPDDARARIEARGFTDVEIVSRAGGVIEFEGVRHGARCAGQVRVAPSGELRIASECEERTLDALERACEHDPGACAEAAASLRAATPPVDWPRATRNARRACEGGLERECLYLGMAHELGGRGVATDREAARALYERACAAGSPPACARRDALR